MSDSDWKKVWAKSRRESERRDNANLGKILMFLCTVIIVSMVWPGYGTEYSGETCGLAVAGFIWGFVMWLKGKDTHD